MQGRGGKLTRGLAVAAAAAMLVSALPASVAADEHDCSVYNVDRQIGSDTLQRAVWDADPGDALIVYGTCVGTTIVGKALEIGWAEASSMPLPTGTASSTGTPRIQSGSWRPALVIDPRVDDFSIAAGLPVIGGVVIGDIEGWRGDATPTPAAWKSAVPSVIATRSRPNLRYCHVRNDDTAGQYLRSQVAVGAASSGDHLSLRGSCDGETTIEQDLTITGWRLAMSSMVFGSDEVDAEDSGPPTLAGAVVDDDVDSLVLKDIRVTDGFRIEDLAP